MTQSKQSISVSTGEFPYPLTDGPMESRYLTWLRNHSNYMAERGFFDYLRIVAVLVRGILINFLTLLPYFLLASLLLGLAYNTLPRFLVTPIALAISAAWVLFFPVVARLSKVVGYKKTLETGSSSSFKRRDLFERSFGGLLFAILAVVLIESFPFLVDGFHRLRDGNVEWAFPTVAGVVGVLVAANKLLPLLGGWIKKLAVVFVGALGLLIPLLVILFVVEFLVYPVAAHPGLYLAVILLPFLIALGIFVTIVLGIRSFGWKGYRTLFLLLIGMIFLFIADIVVLLSANGRPYENFFFILAWTVNIWIFCRLAVDVNLTSINGLYRDRLASAYLVGVDTAGEVDIEEDIDLQEICNYDAGSTAPYHLVNVALNLQGSEDPAIRERDSDFFIFSKKFIGSERTGYCRSENMERVYPQIDLGTAMAISAAAASPNMGRGTNPLMVALMTLLNARLGFWIPHPDRLEKYLSDQKYDAKKSKCLDFTANVFPEELIEIERRRAEAHEEIRPLDEKKEPTTTHNLVGIGFSGGGIRSATINLGIAQALHKRGIFDHIDYMSTVSGGGYLGSSISALMRYKKKPANTKPVSKDSGTVEKEKKHVSLMERFKWSVRPGVLWREMISMLDETHKWVNLSDGGHIENLAAIELLRRRCKYIIIGDGEADPKLHFNGLATLIRYARIDLGIDIDINPDKIRIDKGKDNLSHEHWAVGEITYPTISGNEKETGYLLYLKSSYTGDEDEVIEEYRHRNPDFPHESTADQFFDENQFEAYRALGQHIAEHALKPAPGPSGKKLSFVEMENWFAVLWANANANANAEAEAKRKKKAEEQSAADSE